MLSENIQTIAHQYFWHEWYLTVSELHFQWWTSDSLPLTLQSPPPFHYITFVYVLFFSTLRMAVQHLQGWTGEYLCLICWNQKQVYSSFCTDDNSIVISTGKKSIAQNPYSFLFFSFFLIPYPHFNLWEKTYFKPQSTRQQRGWPG